MSICNYCKGSGIWRESFQNDRPCPFCNGKGIDIPGGETQIIHFVGGTKRTIQNIKAVWENECVHILTHGGIEWIINKQNVLCVEKVGPNPPDGGKKP